MRKVTYTHTHTKGSLIVHDEGVGWFHRFVVIQEYRLDDGVCALVETKTGEVIMIPIRDIRFPGRPTTSEE